MQFLSANKLLYLRVVFLTLLSFLTMSNPHAIAMSGFALLLGEAMRLPIVQLSETDPLLGILSLFLGTLALTDLVPLLAHNVDYFETVVPVRLVVFFIMAGVSYFSENTSLGNNMVFVYCFFEIWFNVLIFSNLKDEKYYRLKDYIEENSDKINADEKVQVVE